MVLIEQIIMENCRLCHHKPGFYKLQTDKKFLKVIYECIKIKINDKCMNLLPPLICEECKTTINCFYSFKQRIRKVDQSLRNILKNAEEKQISQEHLECTQYPAEFRNSEVLQNDLNSHLNTDLCNDDFETEISCVSCKERFQTLDEYGSHQCTVNLDSSTDFLIKVENAIHSESGESLSQVEDCSDVVSFGKKPLKKQIRSETYICDYTNCGKVLKSAKTLEIHQMKHNKITSFLCVSCGKGFYTKNSLFAHEKTHLDEKAYVCKLCNKAYSVSSNLRAHVKKFHEGHRFYCSQCPKVFIAKCTLNRHEKTHTGIKDYQCSSCPSAFYSKQELRKHQRYHEGLRLHKCSECYKAFYESHHLTIHLRRHTGERPFVCKYPNCGKAYIESQKLKRHHLTKHAQM